MRFFFMLLPWLELFTLIKLGAETSALFSLTYVLLTFLLGIALVQSQGRGLLEHMRQAQSGGIMPQQLLLDDMATGFAGLLLIIPGMFTDFLALLVAIGPLRRKFLGQFTRRPTGQSTRQSTRQSTQHSTRHSTRQSAHQSTQQKSNVEESVDNKRPAETIEGTFRRIDEE